LLSSLGHDFSPAQDYLESSLFSCPLKRGHIGFYIVRDLQNLEQLTQLDTSSWNIARWHPSFPHTLTHFDSNADETLRFQHTDIESGVTETVYTFPSEYTRINNNRSSDALSRDGHWVGGLARRTDGDQTLFALNLQTGTLGATLDLSADLYAGPCAPDPDWGEIEPDWVGVSPLGNYLVVQWERDGTTRCSGMETFDIETGAFIGRVQELHPHSDMAVLADGVTEVLVSYEIFHPSGNLSIAYRELPGALPVAEPNYVRVFDDWFAGHISCQGPAGVCLVTTSTFFPDNGHQALEAELFLLYLADGSVLRLAHHRSTECHYWMQPRASLSGNGRYAVFASDWGSQPGACDQENVGVGDAYLIRLYDPNVEVTPTPSPTAVSVTQSYLPTLLNGAVSTMTPIPPTPTITPTPQRRLNLARPPTLPNKR
jgi:hypothetical protein